ncbi:MAG: hypothetical protein U1E42_07100 [Rhodospirillales bacterium]
MGAYRVVIEPVVRTFLIDIGRSHWRANRKVKKVFRVLGTMMRNELTPQDPTFYMSLSEGRAQVHLVPDLSDDEPFLEVGVLVSDTRGRVFAAGSFQTEQERQEVRAHIAALAEHALARLRDEQE